MKNALRDMLYELQSTRLSVVLVPHPEPPNMGACIRAAVSCNCAWYRRMCADFESNRKRQYRKFKTKVKQREIERILKRMIAGEPCGGMYAEWIVEYAKTHYPKRW